MNYNDVKVLFNNHKKELTNDQMQDFRNQKAVEEVPSDKKEER